MYVGVVLFGGWMMLFWASVFHTGTQLNACRVIVLYAAYSVRLRK
jgi:hypothetical protein